MTVSGLSRGESFGVFSRQTKDGKATLVIPSHNSLQKSACAHLVFVSTHNLLCVGFCFR